MTLRQKHLLEAIFLLLLCVLATALENSILSILPLNLGNFQIAHILIFYLALTRSWNRLCFLSLIFAYLSSVNSGLPSGVQIATLMWVAYLIKFSSYSLSFENRHSFVYLSFFSQIAVKSILWVLMSFFHKSEPLTESISQIPGAAIGSSIAAFLLYPLFVFWDQYFEHEAEDARDFNPSI